MCVRELRAPGRLGPDVVAVVPTCKQDPEDSFLGATSGVRVYRIEVHRLSFTYSVAGLLAQDG